MELSCNTHENFFLFVIHYKRYFEAIMTQNNVKIWVKHLLVFVKELNSEYQVPPIENFDSDLSSSEVLLVRHKYDEMVRIVPLKSFLIFGINVWFLDMNTMNSSRAYKKIINFFIIEIC
ncbi:hypothetical protein Glove_212g212 [Diversispora epigaea]|uniref:Uncharacterized protein n=1 Tax=Diversispora epigaea TaxID=1348612 RepID=A0A397IL48_9GLOM|nr:hypothetical protein Glove_212g212 [Diversispora epigaea]